MFEWLVPAVYKFLQHGKDITLSVPFSEPHLLTSMLKVMRGVLGIDEAVAKEHQQKQQGVGGDKSGGGEKGAATGKAAAEEAAQQLDIIHVQVTELSAYLPILFNSVL